MNPTTTRVSSEGAAVRGTPARLAGPHVSLTATAEGKCWGCRTLSRTPYCQACRAVPAVLDGRNSLPPAPVKS